MCFKCEMRDTMMAQFALLQNAYKEANNEALIVAAIDAVCMTAIKMRAPSDDIRIMFDEIVDQRYSEFFAETQQNPETEQ